MPINLDHVGLNTLIQEPVTASQNTIGHELTENVSSYTNTEVASITSGDYLAALNIHRNGPYGWPIFKQTRIGQNPLTRYQNRNSIFTYVTEIGDVKLLKQDGKLIDVARERRDNIREIIEAPVVSNYKPLTLIGSTEVESTRGGLLSKERIEVKATFANETTYFADDQTTREHGVDLETVEDYEDFVDLYLDGGLDSDDSPFDEFEMLRFDQTIFPAPGNMYLNQVRSREEFVNKFWRTNRTDRTQLNVDTGFGVTVNSQSMWPLDATEIHSTVFEKSNLPTCLDGIVGQAGTVGGAGILQNLYTSILHAGAGHDFDTTTAPTPVYSANIVSTIFSSSINQFKIPKSTSFTSQNLSGSGSDAGYLYGKAKWEASVMSGKTPFYDSYTDYAETIRKIGNNFCLIPEFKITDHIDDILKNGKDSELYSSPLLSLTGGTSNISNSNDQNFFKTYSNSDFLKNFEIVQEDNEGFVSPLSLKLKCKAIKKFLPYEDFYPCQQTVTLAKKFHESIKENISVSYYNNNVSDLNSELKTLPFVETLFSPGILYNTIKSGLAVDWPIYYDNNDLSASLLTMFGVYPSGSSIQPTYFSTSSINRRIPFECVLEPEKYISKNLIIGLDAKTNRKFMSASWDGGGIGESYKIRVNNFLAETNNFFLENKSYTTITSIPEGDPNFGNFEIGKTYMMRVKMQRSITGSKEVLEDNSNYFIPPQDNGNIRETFTMYTNPGAFGTLTADVFTESTKTIEFSNWSKYKNPSIPSFSYHTGSFVFDGSADFEDIDGNDTFSALKGGTGNHFKIGNNPVSGYNYNFTPPYYHGDAWADITFKATKEKHNLNEITNNCSTEFYRYYRKPEAVTIKSGGDYINSVNSILKGEAYFKHYRIINEFAAQIPSSVNLFSKGILSDNPGVTSNIGDQYRWIIQSKFETPHLNFNHINYDDIELASWGPEATPIGMWHQYGVIPSASEGVFLQVTDVPPTFIDGPMGGDSSTTGSLADVCGFSTEPVKMGQIKESKVIKEAVVAVPFLEREGERKFFTLDPKDIKHALNEETQNLVGQTVIDQVQRMQEYIFPPSMDFIRNDDIEPFAMYIFEFSHTLSKQDLADIWQNLSPDIGTSHEVAEATISHELLAHELLGDGAKLKFTTTLELDKKQRIKEIPSDIRWMVFKVKKRAASNYFEKIFERNESELGNKEKLSELSATSTGANTGVQYNWPYDFFSLVELVKIDAQVDFAVPDDSEDTLTIKPRKKVKQVDTTPTENEAAINNALFGTGTSFTSPATQNEPSAPVEPNPLGNVSRRRKK